MKRRMYMAKKIWIGRFVVVVVSSFVAGDLESAINTHTHTLIHTINQHTQLLMSRIMNK